MTNADEILSKTKKIREKSSELAKQIADPSVIADNRQWRKLVKEHSSIQDIVEASKELEKAVEEKKNCQQEIAREKDHEMKMLFEEEEKSLDEKIEKLCEDIKILLLPKDENDDKNIIMEIRAAAGGEELWKSAPRQVEKSPPCLQPNFSECTLIMLKATDGRLK